MRFQKGHTVSEEVRAKIRKANTGRTASPETKAKLSAAHKGRVVSAATRAKLSALGKQRCQAGIPMPSTKGRQRTLEHSQRLSLSKTDIEEGLWRLHAWREYQFRRDNYTCRRCKKPNLSGQDCQADHILPRRYFPNMIYHLGNGQTLCRRCHNAKTRREQDIWK